jgi:hypothetical protein
MATSHKKNYRAIAGITLGAIVLTPLSLFVTIPLYLKANNSTESNTRSTSDNLSARPTPPSSTSSSPSTHTTTANMPSSSKLNNFATHKSNTRQTKSPTWECFAALFNMKKTSAPAQTRNNPFSTAYGTAETPLPRQPTSHPIDDIEASLGMRYPPH